MSVALLEAEAPVDGPPKKQQPFSAWTTAVAALLALLVLLAALGSACRGGRGAAHPWCPGEPYVLNFKRPVSTSAARLWGELEVRPDFADLPQRTNECNQLLDLPRIAMMFLARGEMHHEAMWAKWFEGAAGVIPKPTLQEYGCSGARVQAIQRACAVSAKAPVLERQFLYNVYYHPSPDYEGPAAGSLFYGHAIPERLPTTWGSSNLTTAARLMMRHALRDPHAQQFILLSDTGVPLYPATTVYLQLMSESRSRINACDTGTGIGTGRLTGAWEWQPKLESQGGIQRKFWRKNAQWVGLRRPHAEAIMQDEQVYAAFQEHCFSYMEGSHYHQCKVDEHYFSTLLATQGRDLETDCKGYLVTSNWTVPGRHSGGPYEYYPQDVSADLFERLRVDIDWGEKADPSTCVPYAALDMGARGCVPVADLTTASCEDPFGGSWAVLTQECPLFARKFPADTAENVFAVLSDSSNKLGVLPP